VISPQSVWNKRGAEILRAWVASTDFRNEMNFSEEILERTSDSYRRIRNTIRFLISNLDDFDLKNDPEEFFDLGQSENHQTIIAEMKEKLFQRLISRRNRLD